MTVKFVERRWYSVQTQDKQGQLKWETSVKEIPITPIYRAYLRSLKGHLDVDKMGVALENVQARIRGNLLMALSN